MKTTGRKNPALIELVLVILFFALSAIVLVQVFVKAKAMSQTSQAKTLGLLLAQDVIEQWKAEPDRPEKIFLPELGWQEEGKKEECRQFRANCDEELYLITKNTSTASTTSRYYLQAELSEEKQPAGSLYRIRVILIDASLEETLLECETARYLPNIMPEAE